MLQISRRADYAVRIMLELGERAGEEVRVSASELSEKTEVPKAFLHKIIADLVKSGLVRTYKGPTGGFTLARSTTDINMLHIIEAVDGPICLNACLLGPSECPRDQGCPAHTFWGRLQAIVIQEMKTATLDRLIIEGQALKNMGRTEPIHYVFDVNNEAD